MASQAVLWLWVIATFAVVFGVLNRSVGLRWGWAYFGQLAVVLALAALGLLVGPPRPYALAAGGLLVVMHALPALVARRWADAVVVEGDPERASRLAGWWNLISWGPPMALRRATVEALARERAGDRPGALALLAPYGQPGYPLAVRRNVVMTALAIGRRGEAWAEAVRVFEAIDWPAGQPVPHEAAFGAARARLELGDLDAAIATMARAELGETPLPAALVTTYHMPFAAITGDVATTTSLAARLGPRQATLMAGWLARAHWAAGDRAAAIRTLEAALAGLAAGPVVTARMETLLARLRDGSEPIPPAASPAQRQAIEALFARTAGVGVLARGLRPGWTIGGLLLVNAVVFVGVYGPEWLGDRGLTERLWRALVMWMPALRAGEWWRLLTHQVMHLHPTHLALNLVTLWAIGPLAVRLVGPWRFLAIYVLAGVAGALAQGVARPEEALLGASGAIFGAIGVAVVAVWRDRVGLPARWRRNFLRRLGALMLLQFALDWLIPGVAALDHLGGFAAGALVAAVVPLPRRDGAA